MPERGPNPRPTGQTAPPLRFGPAGRFELQPAERRLLVDGRPVAVGGRALDVLITLAVNPDHLLTKNELL
jgi:DNA-binding winged helix-turn-helix (wHTH) protein